MNKFINTKQYFYKKIKIKNYIKLIRFFIMLLGLLLLGSYFKSSANTNKVSINTISPKSINEFIAIDESTTKSNFSTLITSESSISYENNFSETNNTNKELQLLKEELSQYIKKFTGLYGIYYYNLSSHEEFGINDEEQYVAASTIKIPLNLYLYTKINSGEISPKGILPYLEEDYETGTGILQYENFGTTYTVEELSRLSIVKSDNVAANILFRFLGKWNVKGFMDQVGGKVINDFKNLSCPKDMGLYMKQVYEFYTKDNIYGKQLMDSFLNTEFNDRLPKYLSQKIQVAHKIGTQDSVINDVGIVFCEKPYIISVMSKDINEDEASDVLAHISEKIYSRVSAKTQQ